MSIEQRHVGASNELIATVWLLNEGYEVFRNVSQHGPVDIVAMKNGQISLFDVKKAYKSKKGDLIFRLTEEQERLGVKFLGVSIEGKCEIVENSRGQDDPERSCPECGNSFKAPVLKQRFCSNECRSVFHRRNSKTEALEAENV